MTDEQPTITDLLGDPVDIREAITTALVQPETLAALLKTIQEGEAPVEAADPLATAMLEAVDRYFRKKIGPLPWVRHTLPGTVLSVGARTCTVSVAGIDHAVTDVEFGTNKPKVGDSYPVRFPVALPPKGVPLAQGPQPYGNPWIKVQGGETWIYYLGYDFGATRFGLYRVPLPPADDLTFAYGPETVVHLGNFGTFAEGDTEPQWAGATYHSNLIWADSHRWESFAFPEDAPSTHPWPTKLHRYQELGTFGPPSETNVIATSPPHVKVFGSNLSADAAGDYLVGISRYSLQVPEIPNTPATPEQRGKDEMFDLVVSTGGTTWTVVRSGFRQLKSVWLFFTAGGYYQVRVPWVNSTMLDATEWTADSSTAWGGPGERVSVFALAGRNDEPYPGDVRLDGPDDLARALFAGYGSHNVVSVHLYVSRAAGSATLQVIPYPPGWVESFAIRSLGGARLRAWWYGHETQSQNSTTQVITATPSHLWLGEGNQDGSDWTWQMREPVVGPGSIVTVSNDATTIITRVLTDPAHFVSAYYISEDVGEHWRSLPAPPHWDDSYSAHQLWLVDTP
jgi:hypothetical protein